MKVGLIDAETTFGENVEGLYLAHKQAITDEFMDELKSERMAKAALERPGSMNRVARVPTFVWELWMRQGRDPYHATARQIVNWLERDDLQAFISTPKRV